MLGVGGCLFLSSCSNDVATVEGDSVLPILFTASQTGVATEAHTRSDIPAAFPNAGNIAIIASNSSSATAPSDWGNSNLYLNHAAATAGTGVAKDVVTIYPVSLNTKVYWPFEPDKYLGFIAYSPATHASLTHDNATASTELAVSIDGSSKKFFDLLYTLPTATAYNKTTGKDGVPLGEFKHAMAGLVIKVTPVDATDPSKEVTDANAIKDMKIVKLDIQTKVTSGKLDLNSGAPEWTLTAPQSSSTVVHTLISTSTGLPYNKDGAIISYLFPATSSANTVELSSIGFTLKDGSITSVDNAYSINDFKIKDQEPVRLEMGKITVLNIKVKVATIQTGDDDTTTLEGTLIDWVYKGNSSVTIE